MFRSRRGKQQQLIRLGWTHSVHAVSTAANTEHVLLHPRHRPHHIWLYGARDRSRQSQGSDSDDVAGSLKPKLWISDSVKDGAVVGGRAHGVGGDGRLAGACQVQLHHEISHQER